MSEAAAGESRPVPETADPREAASEPEAQATIVRFGAGSRMVHWVHALLFLFLLFSGLVLFLPSLKAIHMGGYRLIPLLHVCAGIAFILSPLPVYLALPDRSRVHDDIRRLFRLDAADGAWGRYAIGALAGARVRVPPVGKFNFGQKLNTYYSVAVTLGLMVTGAVLAVNFFTKSVFSAQFVARVFPLHDFFMLIAIPVVAGHIYLGSLNPGTRESLRGIVTGRVRRRWARQHHALWVDELDGRDA
jgi:formate dehydrogenase subunit gamma